MDEKMEYIANKRTYRNYLFFWTGQLFSLFGSTVAFFAITIWLTLETGNAMFMAIASFMYILPMTVCMPIAGVFADRVNRKTLIIIVDSLQAFATFLLILLFHFNILDPWMMLIFIGVRSVFQAFHLPTVNAIIPAMVPQDRLTKINGINYLFTGVVQLSAQFVAAALLVFLTINHLLWADVITFFIAMIPLLLISIPSVNSHLEDSGIIEKDSFFKEFKMGIKTLTLIPGLTAMIILSMFINFLITPLNTLMSLFILIDHGGTELIYALTLISFQGGMIIGALIASFKKRWGNRMRVIFLGIVFAGIGYAIFSIAPKGAFFIIGIGGFVLGIMLPIINALYQTWIQTIVPKDKIGRVTSIDHTLSMSISPIGTLITGPLAILLGNANLLFYSALLTIATTILIWSFSSIRRINYDDPSLIDNISSNLSNIKL
jgi:DHA3 family macrolide efflux protein-like MFS transporter